MVFLSGFNRLVKLGFKQLNCKMHTGEVQCTMQSTVSAFAKNHVFLLGSALKRMGTRIIIGFEYCTYTGIFPRQDFTVLSSSLPIIRSICTVGYSDYDVFKEIYRGSRVYRCKNNSKTFL
jgi:hypothetical protein